MDYDANQDIWKLKRYNTSYREKILSFSYDFLNNLGCGFASGLVVTGLLNPYDRALFLSLMHKRHFLQIENFRSPYHGLSQTLVQRSFSTGLYFPLENFFLRYMKQALPEENRKLSLILAGNCAGMVNGLILNPLSYIKYQCWGRNNYSFFQQAKTMFRNAGPVVFLRGSVATCLRDACFGATYSYLRNVDKEKKGFKRDVLSAAAGTIVSAPLNYFRNIQFHRNTLKQSLTMRSIFTWLVNEVKQEKTYIAKLKLVQHRFRLGFGTMRVALGMGIGSKLYSLCHKDL